MVRHIVLGNSGHFFKQTFKACKLGPACEDIFCLVGCSVRKKKINFGCIELISLFSRLRNKVSRTRKFGHGMC